MSAFTSAIAACRRIGRKYPDDFSSVKTGGYADIKLRREIRFADYRRAMHYDNKKQRAAKLVVFKPVLFGYLFARLASDYVICLYYIRDVIRHESFR